MSDLIEIDALCPALQAMQSGQYDEAIQALKQALVIEPDQGEATYLLASLYAELGLYDDAIQYMSEALVLDPELHTARLQLGLLYISQEQQEMALSVLAPLEALEEDDPVLCFKQGLCHSLNHEPEAARTQIQRGMRLNQSNPALDVAFMPIMHQLDALNEAVNESANAPVSTGAPQHAKPHDVVDLEYCAEA